MEAGLGKDWVFGIHRFFKDTSTPQVTESEVNVTDYTFQQNNLTIKVGTEVKWLGNDVIMHTITASDLSFSGALRPKGSFSHKFEQPGVYEYVCGIHPSMKGRVEVVP
ncbi:MAG TPA: cupredoxin domain-containing protein [Anaerolineae bacterium]|jgi:plastocyanin